MPCAAINLGMLLPDVRFMALLFLIPEQTRVSGHQLSIRRTRRPAYSR